MRWPRRKWVRWLLAAIAATVVIAGTGFTWLVTTEAGLVRAVALLESLDRVKIHVAGARGRLIGPLTADSIDIEHERATIRIERFAADYEPSEILAGRIAAERVQAAAISIRVHERRKPPGPPGFLPAWLTVSVQDAAIDRLDIDTDGGAELRLRAISGSATVSRGQVEFEEARADAGAWAVAGASGRVLARETLGIEGIAAWTVTESREIGGVVRAMGDLERLRVEAQFALPATGRAEIELTRLATDLRWQGKALIESFDLARWIDEPPFGPLRATLDVSGDKSQYLVNGRVDGTGLPAAGVAIDGHASYADRVVTIPELTMTEADGLAAKLAGSFEFADEPSYDLRTSWTNLDWPLAGERLFHSPRGEAVLAGWQEFTWRVNGVVDPLVAPVFSGTASGRFTTAAIHVDASDLRTLDGRVVATGRLDRNAARAWTVAGRARGIDPAGIRPELPGRLDADFSASGRDFGGDSPWTLSVARLGGRFRGQSAGGSGTVRRAAGRTHFERVSLTLGSARLALDGALGKGEELEARLVADDLSVFLPELAGRIDATLSLRDRSYALAMTGHDLAFGSHRATILSGDAHVDLDDRTLSWIRLRSNGMEVAGFPLTDLRLSADGRVREHAIELRVGAGENAVTVRGQGAWVDSRFTLGMQEVTAVGPRTPDWRLEQRTEVTLSGNDAALTPACIIAGERRVCFEGSWQRAGDWSVQAKTESFPLDTLDQDRPGSLRYYGSLTVDAKASAKAGQPWLADVRADIRDGMLEYESASGKTRRVPMGRTVLAMQSTTERHALDLRMLDASDTSLTAELTATRVAGLSLGELPVTGSLHGVTQQLGLLPLLFTGIDQASGIVQVDLDVAGKLAAPLLNGQARLARGDFDFYQTNLRLRATDATVALRQNALELHATATAGGGSLGVDGRLGWQGRKLNGELTMKGERLLLMDVPEARVFASPDLRFALADRRISVTGSVTIPEARIRPAETAGAVLVSADERIVRPDVEATREEPFEIESDVRLALGEKVQIAAYGLTGRVSGSVRTRSAPHETAVASGELQIHEGEYRAYTRELKVERGRLLFTGGPATDPGVDLRASRKLGIHTVGVIVRGRLRQPQLTLFSEPPLPQAQVASLLIVGQSLDNLQGDDRDTLQSGQASLAQQGGAVLAGQFGRQIGLDEVGIAQGTGDAGAALVIGKFLSPRLYVSYGISLVDEINTLKLRYTIGDRWVIATEAGAESAVDIEYRIDK